MRLQLTVLHKALRAHGATVWLLILIGMDIFAVKTQLGFCIKHFGALLTLEILFEVVPHSVDVQVDLALEALVAQVASDGLLVRMSQHVELKCLFPGEVLAAGIANEILSLDRVFSFSVFLHQLRVAECAIAIRAGIGYAGVSKRVISQSQTTVEFLVADFANKRLKDAIKITIHFQSIIAISENKR